MPNVTLTSTRLDDLLKPHPCLANELGLLVVVEYGDLETVIVGRVVHSKSEFLVPARGVWCQFCVCVCTEGEFVEGTPRARQGLLAYLPSWDLTASLVRVGLLRLLPQSAGTVRVLLAH